MGMEFGVGAALAIGQPVGVPAGEVVGVGVVLVGTVSEEQAEAGAVEFVGGVDDGPPEAYPAFFGGDAGQAGGRLVTGDEGSHPGQDVAGDGEALLGVVVAGQVEDGVEADEGPHLVGPVEAGRQPDEYLDLHTQQLTTTTLIGYFYNDVIHRIMAHVARIQLGAGHLSRGGRQRVAQVEPMGGRVPVEVSAGYAGQ